MNELISRGKRIDVVLAGRLVMLTAGLLFALALIVAAMHSEREQVTERYWMETKRQTEKETRACDRTEEPGGVAEKLPAETDAACEPVIPDTTEFVAAADMAAGNADVSATPSVPSVIAPTVPPITVPVFPDAPAWDSKEEHLIGKAEHESMNLEGTADESEAEIVIPETEAGDTESGNESDEPAVVPPNHESSGEMGTAEETPSIMMTAQGFGYDAEGMIVSCPESACIDGLLALPSDTACKGIRACALDSLKGEVSDVYIPANIAVIESGTFDRFEVFWFEVDPENPTYTSIDGMLCLWDGTFV